ncbi:uncharacterized protein LOC110248789 isoform X2 [Exaiptasia diaphana]|uniref:MARVEL domain-containing protein n=1 Tax=Exaiptasia diaphana TaxID=2652724 RepID=A0A913YV09_EXADI|nr:uncharacterized protein LOC110248789 isoform X3 [Exaiptasia diaphana]XP_028517896.1 uncharacterized protein LOC110248789 isoform X2 [Exaiptasia diaphana]
MAINKAYAWGRGLLKLFLVIVSCVAFICMIVADDKTWDISKGDEYKRRYTFFLFAHIAGAGSSLLIYLLFLFDINNSVGSRKCWSFLVMIISLTASVVYIVACGLLVERAKDEHESGWYKLSDTWELMTNLRITALASGFICAILFLIDALLHCKELR